MGHPFPPEQQSESHPAGVSQVLLAADYGVALCSQVGGFRIYLHLIKINLTLLSGHQRAEKNSGMKIYLALTIGHFDWTSSRRRRSVLQ